LLAAIGGLAPVLPLMAGPVVPPPSTAASAGVGLPAAAAAAAAAAKDDVVAAAYDGAAGGLGGTAQGVWRLGGMATIAIAIESVTATVIDLYVYWKPGFVIRLEAWLSAVGFEFDSTAWFQLESTIGGLELDWARGDIRLGLNDLITQQRQQMSSSLARVRESIFNDSIAWQWRQQTVAVQFPDSTVGFLDTSADRFNDSRTR